MQLDEAGGIVFLRQLVKCILNFAAFRGLAKVSAISLATLLRAKPKRPYLIVVDQNHDDCIARDFLDGIQIA